MNGHLEIIMWLKEKKYLKNCLEIVFFKCVLKILSYSIIIICNLGESCKREMFSNITWKNICLPTQSQWGLTNFVM